jgi:hypothetical protein
MKYYARITDPEKWDRVSFLKRTMKIKTVTHFRFVMMVVFLFFFNTYKAQEVLTLMAINQQLNNALELSEQVMDFASETVKKQCE